jgi:hypothetical protein
MARDEDEQPSRGFKFEDRRRFTGDAESAARPEAEPAATPPPAAERATTSHADASHDHDHHDHDHGSRPRR